MELKFTKKQTLTMQGNKMLLSDEDCWTQTNCKYSDSFIVEVKWTDSFGGGAKIIRTEFRFELENLRCLGTWDCGKDWNGKKANYRLTCQYKDTFSDWMEVDENLEHLHYTDIIDTSCNYHTRKEALEFVNSISNYKYLLNYLNMKKWANDKYELLSITKITNK